MNPYIHTEVSQFSQAHIQIEIEHLVNDIISDQPKQLMIHHPWVSQSQYYYQFYMYILGSLDRYLSTYSILHDYTEHADAFWYGCQQAGLLPSIDHYGLKWYRLLPPNLEQIKILVNAIREYAHRLDFRRRAGDRLQEMKKKRMRQEADVRKALSRYSKSLVITMQFGIDKRFQHLVDIDRFFDLVDLLSEQMERNPLYSDNLFQSKVIEQGITKGYHMHLGVVFNGHVHWSEGIALLFRETWLRITQGMGTFHTSNTVERKMDFKKCGMLGVGMIFRDDVQACENAIRALCYTTKIKKIDQYLRMKPRGRRAFAKGLPRKVRYFESV